MFWPFTSRRPARAIFQFWDGQRERFVDPSIVLRAIETDPKFNLELHGALIDEGNAEAVVAGVNCVHRAFGVKDFSQGGLLEAECLQLLLAFLNFLDSLKKNISASPIESEPTESATSTASTDPAPTPSNSPSPSISSPIASS